MTGVQTCALPILNANGVCANLDTDGDGIIDSMDLDSDNDGITDLEESGAISIPGVADADFDGRIDTASSTNVGTNGIFDAIETAADSGLLSYTLNDSDADTNYDFLELDSDNDGCNDVLEAGFTDDNGDGLLGPLPVTVNANGLITSGSDGYTLPNDNDANFVFDFQEAGAAPSIIVQPANQTVFVSNDTTFSVTTNNADTYQWQVSTDGGLNFNDITDGAEYTDTQTATLTVNNVDINKNGYLYSVQISSSGLVCSAIISNTASLTVRTRTVITNRRITYRVKKN